MLGEIQLVKVSTLKQIILAKSKSPNLVNRGGQKNQMLDSEVAHYFFPLYSVSGVSKKIFSVLPLIFHPPLAPYIMQRKFLDLSRFGNTGVKRCVRTSGMKTNAIKQLSKKFNGSKFQNTDFRNFPLYFLKFPLYNIRG